MGNGFPWCRLSKGSVRSACYWGAAPLPQALRRNIFGNDTMKLLPKISLGLFICTVSLAAFGIVKYPDAPIKHNELGYFDKRFNSYSEKDYTNYQIWEGSLLIVGIATSLSVASCLIIKKRF